MSEVITETILPGTYIEVRAEGLIQVGAIDTGNIGVIGTAEMGGSNRTFVRGRPNASLCLTARRPHFSALSSERGTLMPSLERGLENYFHERKQARLRHCADHEGLRVQQPEREADLRLRQLVRSLTHEVGSMR